MIYAPVVIITLNRYEHLKRCVEALENCTDAEFTELFISVDYPPDITCLKEKSYRYPEKSAREIEDGNQCIIKYLKEKSWRFKKVNLYFQESNLGASKNSKFLKEIVFEKYDRLITLEDDVEVSKNFLVYINQALEYGYQDEKCYCVCSWKRDLNDKVRDFTAYKGNSFNAWGVGIYREKYRRMREVISYSWLDSIILNTAKMYKIYRKRPNLFYILFVFYFINHSPVFFEKDGKIRTPDMLQTTYMIMNNMYAIYPIKNKSRNHGFDGSGLTSKKAGYMRPEVQLLDDADDFELKLPEKDKVNKKINQELKEYVKERKYDKAWVYYLSHRVQIAYFVRKKFPALYEQMLRTYKKIRKLD